MENQYYRVEIDPASGAIKSLYDKPAGKELVDQASPYKLNHYLYVSGGPDTLIIDNVYGRPLPDLSVDSPSSAHIVENVKTPLGQRITVEASARNTPKITSEYLLYDNLKRLDIRNRFEKAEVRDHEAVYFAFPFPAAKPVLEYQIQNGWVRPNEDQLPGAAREWFTTQNLVHVRDGDFSVAWASPDAPLMTLEDINRGKWPKHLDIKNGYVFSYPLNNYCFTNYKAAQGGKFSFSYAITSGNGLGRQALARFDADIRQPVFAYPLFSTFSASVEGKGRPLSATQASLMSLDDPNTQFVVFKAAEDGDGYVLRFREIAGQFGAAELHFPTLQIKEAYLCNGVEVIKQKLESTRNSVKVPYTQNEYVTVRLRAEEALGK
jgi:alpha-mannosidase